MSAKQTEKTNVEDMDGEEILRHIYYRLNGIHTILCIFMTLTIIAFIISLRGF